MNKTTDLETSVENEIKSLILESLAGARVPRDTRERLSVLIEGSFKSNLNMLHRYVVTFSTGGRAAEMMRMYASGSTLQEIASHYDVTREWVRRILTTTFGDYRSMQPESLRSERLIHLRIQANNAWDATNGDQVERLIALGAFDHDIAKVLGCSHRKVVEYRTRHSIRRTRGLDWTDEQIHGFLQEAHAHSGGKLTIASFNRWREEMGKENVPSYQTITIRYPTFRQACAEAGVNYSGRFYSAPRSDYINPRMCQEHLVAFVAWCNERGLKPTSGTYAVYRKEHKAPSLAIIARRLGGFRHALNAAIAESLG